MSEQSRRGFLAMAGAGAAVVGTAAVIASGEAEAEAAPRGEGQLVVHVEDVQSGTMTLMYGEKEVLVTDKALVAKLTRAAEM